MFHWAHVVLAGSNAFGLPATLNCIMGGRVWHAVLIVLVMAASTLMHLSETKHGLLPPPFWWRWSNAFLNIDRFMAVTATLYFSWAGWHLRSAELFFTFGAAIVISAIGEITQNLAVYVPCHLLWHAAVYWLLTIVA